jgi:phage baseplate assembly protein W
MAQQYVGITLPMTRGNTGYFSQSTTILEQTKSNLKNLLLTRKGERLGLPTFGCDLWRIVFEQITDETKEQARLVAIEAIDSWLPFLEIAQFDVTENSAENRIDIYCLYRFRSNPNVTDSVTFSLGGVGTDSSTPTPSSTSTTTIRSGVRGTVPSI